MPSTWTASLRFEKQGIGENLNTWGVRLNSALDRLDKAIAGGVVIPMTGGTYTLSTANGLDDEARSAILLLTGTGGTLILPSASKLYTIRNAGSGDATVTTGAGTTVVVRPGDMVSVMCDGANVSGPTLGGLSYKAYVDAQAFAALAGNLPGQAGSAGYFLTTDATTASWRRIMAADLGDIATERANAKAFAIAAAICF